jgi:hypothetical protein
MGIGLGIRFSSRRVLETLFSKSDARIQALEQAQRDAAATPSAPLTP